MRVRAGPGPAAAGPLSAASGASLPAPRREAAFDRGGRGGVGEGSVKDGPEP